MEIDYLSNISFEKEFTFNRIFDFDELNSSEESKRQYDEQISKKKRKMD